ncbi:DUF2238 domain-containing protein [Sphingobium sp. CR28]|uniref:DUF2238 domain-containing protein n=1 Tax=Sphingobium sp. CR28 TaxID=3400272 RepID=UPI003FEDA5A6
MAEYSAVSVLVDRKPFDCCYRGQYCTALSATCATSACAYGCAYSWRTVAFGALAAFHAERGVSLAFLAATHIGWRYIYSNVPYDGWVASITGRTLSDMFGMARNGYDRLVHFMFGLLITPVLVEIARRHGGLARRSSWIMAFALVGLVSALYEIFEWLLTVIAAGKRPITTMGSRATYGIRRRTWPWRRLAVLLHCLPARSFAAKRHISALHL